MWMNWGIAPFCWDTVSSNTIWSDFKWCIAKYVVLKTDGLTFVE